jgi:hypothetical protein
MKIRMSKGMPALPARTKELARNVRGYLFSFLEFTEEK